MLFLELNYLWFVDDWGNDKIHADEQHQERNENRNLKKNWTRIIQLLIGQGSTPLLRIGGRICKYYAGIFDHQDSSYASSKPLYFCHWSINSTSNLILFLIFLNNIGFFMKRGLKLLNPFCDAAAKIHNLWKFEDVCKAWSFNRLKLSSYGRISYLEKSV